MNTNNVLAFALSPAKNVPACVLLLSLSSLLLFVCLFGWLLVFVVVVVACLQPNQSQGLSCFMKKEEKNSNL